jgi:hypothetical protein
LLKEWVWRGAAGYLGNRAAILRESYGVISVTSKCSLVSIVYSRMTSKYCFRGYSLEKQLRVRKDARYAGNTEAVALEYPEVPVYQKVYVDILSTNTALCDNVTLIAKDQNQGARRLIRWKQYR